MGLFFVHPVKPVWMGLYGDTVTYIRLLCCLL